jgi:hypothetical protein
VTGGTIEELVSEEKKIYIGILTSKAGERERPYREEILWFGVTDVK